MTQFNRHSATLLKRAIDSGITSPAELATLMGQTSVESLDFHRVNENLHYRDADRAFAAVKGLQHRHTRDEVAAALATRDPETIANLFYDTHPTLGNREPGDGWRFHGRGVIQLTGRENYRTFGRLVGVDLVANPDLASEPDVSADVAIAYWNKRCRDVDPTNVRATTIAINGGMNGYPERLAAVDRWSTIITPELVESLQNGALNVDDLMAMNVATRTTAAHSLLRTGSRGEDVRELQTQLHDLGYAVRPDGDFGSATRDAVMTFQRNHGLPSDGIAGPLTISSANTAHRNLREMPGPFVNEELMDRSRNIARDSSIDEMFESLCRAADNRDFDALCAVGRRYGETPDAHDWLQLGQQHNQQMQNDALAAQQSQTQAQEQSQAPQPAAPAMSL